MPLELNLFGLGQKSKSPNITAMQRLNVYYEPTQYADKAQITALGTPGTVLFSRPSSQVTRGMFWHEQTDMLYVVQRGDLWAVANDGTNAKVATLDPTDIVNRASIASNGTQLCIVTGVKGYIFDTGTDTLTDISAQLPAEGCDTVTFLDSYFIANRIGTGQFYISAQYDGLTWNALDYATAESSPDNLMAVMADKGYLALFGTSSTEIWADTGDLNFPFARVNGSPSQTGLIAKWSLSRCGEYLTGLFRNKHGALFLGQLQGYQIVEISNPDVDYAFNRLESPQDAVGFGYTLNGRTFYQISFQADAQSWLYDFTSGAWSKLKGWGIPRHIGHFGTQHLTKFIVSSYLDGSLYYFDLDTYTDNGIPIEREITSGHVFSPGRNKMIINRLRIDMEGGSGLLVGQGSPPTIMLQVSRDGGHTWGGEMWKTIGKQGEYQQRAEWRRLGTGRDLVFKLRMTDPVKFVLINGVMEGKEAAK